MVQGEDGGLWCHANNLTEAQISESLREVAEGWPNAQSWTESENPSYNCGDYDVDFDDEEY